MTDDYKKHHAEEKARQKALRRGTPIGCYVCGNGHSTLFRLDKDKYVCLKLCLRKWPLDPLQAGQR